MRLELAPELFLDAVATRRAVTFRHGLGGVDHELLRREAIAGWADELPASWIEHHLANLPLVLPRGDAPRLDLSPGDVVRGLEHNGCWIVLWYLERLPGYRALLNECLDGVLPSAGDAEGGARKRGANLFLASPEAVVPAHFDRHHNLLLQVEGTKEISVGHFADPGSEQREVERNFAASENTHVLPPVQTTFRLGPGDGLYIPPYAFHWVRGGPDVSLSLSCGFRTAYTERAELVHTCNTKLRRIHISPRPPGRSELRDRAKATTVRLRRRLRRTSTARAAL